MNNKDHAVYEIADGTRHFTARLFKCSDESCKLTPEEIEVEEVVREGVLRPTTLWQSWSHYRPFQGGRGYTGKALWRREDDRAELLLGPNRIRY